MDWVVEGASKSTGEDLRIYVTARDSDRAAQEGMDRGLLVANVSPLVVPDRPTPIVQEVPDYSEIATGATWLYVIAMVVHYVGVLLMVLGAGALILAGIAAGLADPKMETRAAEQAMSALYMLGTGVLHLAAAAIMRMLASLGRAIRDMARNSHRA